MIIGGKVTFKTPQGFEHKGAVVELSFDNENDLDRAAALAQKKALEMVGLSAAGVIIPPASAQKTAATSEMIHDQHGPAAPAPETSAKTTTRKMPGPKAKKEETLNDPLGDVPQIRSNPEDRKEPEAKADTGTDLGGDAPITDKDLGDHCNRAAGRLITAHPNGEAAKLVRALVSKFAPRVAEIAADKRKTFLAELDALK